MNITHLVSSKNKSYGILKITVRRRNGSIKYVREQQVDSLTRTLWIMLRAWMSGLSSVQAPRYSDGANDNISTTNSHQTTKGGAGTNMGIILGTGSGAVLVTNHQLSSLIPHGVATGEMNRSANEVSLGNSGYTITRVFENSSGSTVNISEAGVTMVNIRETDPALNRVMLFCRDLVDPAVPVEDGESATVVYDLFFNTGNRNLGSPWRQMIKEPITSFTDFNVTFWRANGTTADIHWATSLNTTASAGQARNIFVGSGDTAPAIDDLDLETLIPHGVESGQLLYGTGETSALQITNNNERLEFDTTRVITNESGDDITIREIALFSNTSISNMGTRTMLDRYVLPTPITLAHGESRVARWLFRYAI